MFLAGGWLVVAMVHFREANPEDGMKQLGKKGGWLPKP
jgi:hypothetical protein